MDQLRRFIDAFRHSSGCRRTCACGRVFYDPDVCWYFEEGELEDLEADPKATPSAVESFTLRGREFVAACDCWHELAWEVINFIEAHSHEIARFINGEKEAAKAAADLMPTVNES